ncbi:MAG: heme ABC exporter ATP-binding protein CcmA [Acidimicrobiales bacterium]|nr:MAG: heme ABC exporter ATP-binding protein CcmA [Acidimicrobiales bacterium]
MAAAIHFRNAVALSGRFPALSGVDVEVDPGEVVLVEGPNGAGKTSLLRACAGLLAVVDGEAEVLGHNLRSDRRSIRRKVGMLGHASFLYDDLSVIENLVFALRAARLPVGGLRPVMDRLGLGGRLADTRVGSLSAGQRRRVALAVLVARAPVLWLLDEPHAGLDESGRDILDELVHEAVDGGATVMLASHEPDRAGALAHRVVRMAGGCVVGLSVPGPRLAVPGPRLGQVHVA